MTLVEESRRISEAVRGLKAELESQWDDTVTKIDEAVAEIKHAAEAGDLSENAGYDEAIKSLNNLQSKQTRIARRQTAMKGLSGEENYTPIGMVVMFSTVRLVNDQGREFIVKLYPSGIYDVSKGIISIDTLIGKMIYRQTVGYRFTIRLQRTAEEMEFEIKEIY